MIRSVMLCLSLSLASCAGSPQADRDVNPQPEPVVQPGPVVQPEPVPAQDPAVRAAELAVKIANGRATAQEIREYEAFLRSGK